jgi:1-phosphofructokinase family hexose kinase
MFICVSLNPAIDKRLTLPSLIPGRVLRVQEVRSFPGGKSTHVAMVLHTLGEAPQWIGPCGAATGSALVTGLAGLGIAAHPCPTQQPTRTNLEIIEDGGRVTEILEPGCAPSAAELDQMENACGRLFRQGREASVIFSGSLPGGAPSDLYARLIALANELGCRTFLDTSGEPLRLALAALPHFVKPNRDEAAQLLGTAIDSVPAAAAAVRKLVHLGARSAAISLGADGLIYCPGEASAILFAPAISLQPISMVGCGDAALAGFARAVASDGSSSDTLRLAAACGAANCLAESPGAAKREDIERFRGQVVMQTLPSGP